MNMTFAIDVLTYFTKNVCNEEKRKGCPVSQ
jgi:hypothetical protein